MIKISGLGFVFGWAKASAKPNRHNFSQLDTIKLLNVTKVIPLSNRGGNDSKMCFGIISVTYTEQAKLSKYHPHVGA
ncbi:hypothetical protein AAY52_05475 [Vibrio metoecus]|nr:hypothetical protein AAY52_05475 [Vibrio metoecus]